MVIPNFLALQCVTACKAFFMARTKEFDCNEILDKAVELFWQKGYNATSAQDLVDGLGISRSSLYDTFGDKRTLFIKALEQYRVKTLDSLEKKVEESADVEGIIKCLFASVKAETFEGGSPKGCFMVNSTVEFANTDTEIAGILHKMAQDTEDAITKAIKRGQDEGVYTKNLSARKLARFVVNSINGLRIAAKSEAGKKTFDDIVQVSLAALKS